MRITTTAPTPLPILVTEEAKRLAAAVALTATFTVLGTILVPVLAVAIALAGPVLPLLVVILGREPAAG